MTHKYTNDIHIITLKTTIEFQPVDYLSCSMKTQRQVAFPDWFKKERFCVHFISPHTLRHSFATHLLAGGASISQVQDMLGHENITTTEIYTHLDISAIARALEEYHPLG